MNTQRPHTFSGTISSSTLLVLFLGISMGCASPIPLNLDGKSPTSFDEPATNWPIPPTRAEYLMREVPMQIVSEVYAGAGIGGARRIEVQFPGEDQILKFKWKTMPSGLDGINNSPRRELASYQAQSLFLDPNEYLIPPSIARCLAPAVFPEPADHLDLVQPNTQCELGVLSLWLRHVTIPDPLYDEVLFSSDPTYARLLANFNILTYLIHHRDGRDGNFLISTESSRPITFAIDNGMTFGGFFYNWFVDNWDDIEVPALPRDSIDRLRKLRKRHIKTLGVVAELHLDSGGVYRSVEPGKNLDREEGVRTRRGVIQFGLTEDEVENLWERIEHLLEDVDDGKIPLF